MQINKSGHAAMRPNAPIASRSFAVSACLHAVNSCKNRSRIYRCRVLSCPVARRRCRTIAIDTIVAQAEGSRQLPAAQQFAILHIGALQNIDPVMRAVGFNFCESEACVSAEHRTDHLVENLKKQRPDKRELCGDMQPFPVRLYADSSIRARASSCEIYLIIRR